MRTLKLALLSLAMASGCANNMFFSDDEGADHPKAGLTGEHPDELSLPYAQGSAIKISIGNVDREGIKGLKITTDSEAVLKIDKLTVNDNSVTADCTAAGEGETMIRLTDGNGAERRAAPITVKTADRARVFAHGLVRVAGREEPTLASAEVSEIRALTGGKAAYAVAYFRGTERLYGHGIAKTEQSTDLTIERKTSSNLPANEFLFVSPTAPGESQLRILQDTRTLALLPVSAVAESALTSVTLTEELTPKSEDKQRIWVFARAKDAQQRDVHGVYCSWTLDGAPQIHSEGTMKTTGDFYRYYLGRDAAPATLAAACKSLSAQTQIRAVAGDDKGNKGFVNDTTYLGCSAAAGSRPVSLAWAALLLVPLALRLRRRMSS
jgi:hypothetical protein